MGGTPAGGAIKESCDAQTRDTPHPTFPLKGGRLSSASSRSCVSVVNSVGSGEMVMVGVIAGAHGVRGAVRVKSFTETPEGVAAYGPVYDESGSKRFDQRILGATKGGLIAKLSGVDDRNAAEALRGQRLCVPRTALPQTEEEEFYHADLVGLTVETVAGETLGRVRAVPNYGAGDLIEVERPGARSVELPFTRAVVPVVDLRGRRLVVEVPEGLLDEAPAQADPSAEAEAEP